MPPLVPQVYNRNIYVAIVMHASNLSTTLINTNRSSYDSVGSQQQEEETIVNKKSLKNPEEAKAN